MLTSAFSIEGVTMEDKDIREFHKVLGLTATVDILKSIEQGRGQYKDFLQIAGVAIINRRIRQLIDLKIIEHHFEREHKRREWYTLTKKGKRVVKAINRLEEAFQKE